MISPAREEQIKAVGAEEDGEPATPHDAPQNELFQLQDEHGAKEHEEI